MLKEFLKENIDIERFRICLRDFYRNITLIQKKMRDACVAKEAKVEVLMNYWDKMYGVIQQVATRTKDKEVGDKLCIKLLLVPKAVRYEMFTQYVQ